MASYSSDKKNPFNFKVYSDYLTCRDWVNMDKILKIPFKDIREISFFEVGNFGIKGNESFKFEIKMKKLWDNNYIIWHLNEVQFSEIIYKINESVAFGKYGKYEDLIKITTYWEANKK